MQTNHDEKYTYSRPNRGHRRKNSYELVGPPLPGRESMADCTTRSDDYSKRSSIVSSASSSNITAINRKIPLKSPSFSFGSRQNIMKSDQAEDQTPPPLPTTARPSGTYSDGGTAPPLPPRNSVVLGNYSAPRPVRQSTGTMSEIYNIPRPVADRKSASPLPTYDSLPPARPSNSTTSSTATINPQTNKLTPNQLTGNKTPTLTNKIQKQPSPKTEFTVISESMSLATLVKKYQDEFPLVVEVSAGFFGDSEKDTFSEGDKLNIHFIKHVAVAVIECGGREIKIPLNSNIKFSPLYNPNDDYKQARTGMQFKTVKDITSMKNMPSIVQARKTQKSLNSAHGVDKGEILKVVEIKQGRFGGQSLICASLDGRKLKRLSESCNGDFTTDPTAIQLYLPEITSLLPLPHPALPCIDHMQDRDLPLAGSELVTIVRVEKEKTVVATCILDDPDSPSSSPVMFDIPVDLDILEVQIIEQDEYEQLYADTRQLMERFDPCKSSDHQVRVGKAQSLYYCDVREDDKTAGIELIASESIYQDTPSLLAMRDANRYKYDFSKSSLSIDSLLDNNYKEPTATICDETTKLPPPTIEDNSIDSGSTDDSSEVYTEMQLGTLKPKVNDSVSSLQDVPAYGSHGILDSIEANLHLGDFIMLKMEFQDMKVTVSKLNDTIKEYENRSSQQMSKIQQLQETVQTLQQKLEQHGGNYVQLVPTGEVCIQNFTCDQLLDFLDKNNMTMYKESFNAEKVDGPLLAQLDEEILMNELGVKSKLHCRKLLLYAQGKFTN